MTSTADSGALWTRWIDLAQTRLGSRVVYATDDFFAPKDRLIDPREPVFLPDEYDENGKWMDGWESRRRRDDGHDHCIVCLGQRGIVKGIDIDTRHFTGNYPPAASIDACVSDAELPGDAVAWTAIVPVSPLNGDSHNMFAVDSDRAWTHLKLNIYPDGGVARLRVFGHIRRDWSTVGPDDVVDLAAMVNGGNPVACNDEHFGKLGNIIAPGHGRTMGDGWETRRRREPGSDWGILALAHPGTIEEVLVDTAHFKGNYPDRCSLQAARVDGEPEELLPAQSQSWPLLLPQQRLSMDAEHLFRAEVAPLGPVSHVRVNMIPDGGISRLRLFGRIDKG